MVSAVRARAPHLTAVLRSEDRVTPLELFFDLVFALALTQWAELRHRLASEAGSG